MIDLHTHSTASDGTLSPHDLVREAVGEGLSAVAITDHDTTAGLDEGIRAAAGEKITFVGGVEISAEITPGSLHLVGLYIDHQNSGLQAALNWLVESRSSRNEELVQKLAFCGVPIALTEVKALARGSVIARPHFAELMVKKGYVQSIAEAFDKYLGRGKAAYVPKRRLDRVKAIDAIRQAGGVPILAHPDQTLLRGDDLEQLVKELKNTGLEGIETRYTGYSKSKTRELNRLSRKYALVESGGSDFHGSIKPEIKLGRGLGKLFVPDELLLPIAERAAEIRSRSHSNSFNSL